MFSRRFTFSSSLAMFICVLANFGGFSVADEVAPVRIGKAPPSVEAATEHLERVFGKHNDKLKHEWRFPIKFDGQLGEKDGGPAAHVTLSGSRVYGTPYRLGDSLAIDEITAVERTVYDLDSRGKKTTRSVSQTHRVERIVIRQFGDAWFFDECQISSSSADQTGIVESLGSVEWLADGIRLTGEEGAAERLGPDGKQTLGSAVFTLEIRRQGQVLNYRYDSQAYRLAKTPSGQLLQSPDTLSPLGKPFSKQETSESWFAGHD